MARFRKVTFSIASGGTLSNLVPMEGWRLVSLILPALNSTTIQFNVSPDDQAANAVTMYSGSTGVAPAAITLGSANTGGFSQPVPDDVGKQCVGRQVQLLVATQSGGARTITGICVPFVE